MTLNRVQKSKKEPASIMYAKANKKAVAFAAAFIIGEPSLRADSNVVQALVFITQGLSG